MKVSVIIPVYNAAPYIADTLQSLLHQTMSDFEVLLVDDHGTDDSIAVAKSIVGEDSRFRFLQTPVNAGPGVARNVGIESAQGEYIAFLDSDDLWEPDFLASLYQSATEDGSQKDLCYCQLRYQGGSREGEIHRNPVVENGAFTPDKKKHFLSKFVTFSVCFLFRRDFLLANDLRFPANRNSEDTNFLTRCLLLAETIACVDTPLYIYIIRSGSLTTGHNSRRYRERLEAVNALMHEFCQLKKDARYQHLRLGQYTLVMWWIWFKKGFAQAIKEIL